MNQAPKAHQHSHQGVDKTQDTCFGRFFKRRPERKETARQSPAEPLRLKELQQSLDEAEALVEFQMIPAAPQKRNGSHDYLFTEQSLF